MRRVLKWIGYGLGGLLGLAIAAAVVLGFIGRSKVTRTYTAGHLLASVHSDSLAIARGQHQVQIHGCQACHGAKLDGTVALDMPIVLAVASNLTSGKGGVAKSYTTAADWDRAVRYGIRPNGKWIIPMMPFAAFNNLSDDDANDVVAYLQNLPPVDHELPASRVKLLGYPMVGIMGEKMLRGELGTPPRSAPPSGTAAYGKYLVSTTCGECHGRKLEGAQPGDPESPPAPNLKAYAFRPQPEFAMALQTGVAMGGRKLTKFMPWEYFRNLTDDEITSVYLYLKELHGVR
jgi:cytochrome c553